MNCRDIEQELSASIDGEVTDAVRAEIEAHVATCPDCRKRLAELKKLVEGTAQIPKQQTAQQFLSEVRRKIAADATPERKTWADVLFRPAWLKVPIEALALIVILVTATLLIRPANRPVETLAMKEAKQPVRNGNEDSEAQAARTPVAAAHTGTAGSNGRLALPQSPGVAAPSALESSPAGTFSREVAKADNLEMLTGGESMVVFNYNAPSETVTVKANDVAPVRHRAQIFAALWDGRVIATEKTTDALGNIYVIMPATRVEAFKTQFAATNAPPVDRQKAAPVKDGQTFVIGDVFKEYKVRLPGDTDMVDRVYFKGERSAVDEDTLTNGTPQTSESNIVLEIRVLPMTP